MEQNKFLIGDNLEILQSIEDNELFDCVYMDPPYNTGRNFGDFEDKWKNNKEYVDFLRPRIIEIYRLLKNTGNIIVHIEPKISHYVRFLLDEIFGENNFRNEIVWKTSGNKKSSKQLSRNHDTILVYSKSNKSYFSSIYFPYDEEYKNNSNVKICEKTDREYVTTAAHNSQPDVIVRKNLRYEWNGHKKQWWVSKEKMKELDKEGRLEYNSKGIPRIKRFLDEMEGIPLRDVWTDISSVQIGEKINYATQKPIALIYRILELYTKENDFILDPFAGSGTIGRACINRNRNYFLIDINKEAKEIFQNSIIKKKSKKCCARKKISNKSNKIMKNIKETELLAKTIVREKVKRDKYEQKRAK